MNIFDEYHDSLCNILISTSNSIDDYLIEGNRTESSKTYAEFSTSVAKENRLDLENDIRFRLRLNLPKVQKNLRLYFEDESSDNLLYDGTTLDDKKLDNKRYYLRLEFLNYVKNTFGVRVGAGARLRKGNIVPYFNIRSKYKLDFNKKFTSQFYDRFRQYSDGEVENSFEFNSLYSINDNLYLAQRNTLYYNSYNPLETLVNDLSVISVFNEKQQISFGLGVSSSVDSFERLNTDYYYLHSAFHHLFYKDWAYYEISPSILQREINNFETTYRLLIRFGIYFKHK